ncbi:hypothetical protein V5N11_031224 [Cardamine amara subsp. amara]|uniref:Uncharacterized protein n=1 Tax=Cardamine amara subsp. amara TaxID=228776 RepID=A0ABD1C3R2_CARAN
MNTTESKGRRAWYDKIYRKLETILVEVDTLASQGKASLESSDPSGLDFVKDETEELREDHCKSSCELPLDQKFDISQNGRLKEKLSDSVLIDKQMLSSSLLLEDHNECNETVATSLCQEKRISSQESLSTHRFLESFVAATACNDDTFVSPSGISTGASNLIPLAAEIQAVPLQDKLANTRSFSSNSIKVNQDDFFIEDFDFGPLDTIDLYDMTFREDPSDFDDNLLYAACDRTRQLRSFKRKIMDALTSKRRRAKEYEQLSIWFGDADMGPDLAKTKEHTTTSIDSKSSQSNVPFSSEDSEWELL